MYNLNIPQAPTGGLFRAPYSGPMDTMDAAHQGLERGMKLRGAFSELELKQRLRELVRKHDITTPQGKLALVRELSESGLGDEVIKLQESLQRQAGQVLDTPEGYQIADPTYGRAFPMQGGGLMGQAPKLGAPMAPPDRMPQYPGDAERAPMPQAQGDSSQAPMPSYPGGNSAGGGLTGRGLLSHRAQDRISEQELREGFNAWHDHIAKPFAEMRKHKFSSEDINRLRMTLPKELQGQEITEKFFQGIQAEPAPRSGRGGSSTYNPGGLSSNLTDIDQELAAAEDELAEMDANKPDPRDFAGQKEALQRRHQLRSRINRLKEERRRYQAKVPPKGGSGSGGGARKLTDPNKAREYLERAGGDKDKAREMARRDGWTF